MYIHMPLVNHSSRHQIEHEVMTNQFEYLTLKRTTRPVPSAMRKDINSKIIVIAYSILL